MSNFYDLKNRINSTKNTGQVTKALQIVAASKQKKTQDNLKNSRFLRNGLRQTMRKVIKNLTESNSVNPAELPMFFRENLDSKKVLIINVMSGRGLCGGMNSKLFYKVLKLKDEIEAKGESVDFISVNKISQKFLRNFHEKIIAFFGDIKETPDLDEVQPLITLVKESAIKYEKIFIAYSDFIKTGIYEPRIEQLLPIHIEEDLAEEEVIAEIHAQYLIEPDSISVLEKIANFFIDLEIYEAILSNIASENTARMISMKKATDNIKTLVESLTLKLNKERQAKITQQVAEISANL